MPWRKFFLQKLQKVVRKQKLDEEYDGEVAVKEEAYRAYIHKNSRRTNRDNKRKEGKLSNITGKREDLSTRKSITSRNLEI